MAAAGQVYGLVLAAGQGRRFGGGKLLASFRGRPLLSYTLGVVAEACQCRLLAGGNVVIAFDDHRARELVEAASLFPVLNTAPHLGLSHSIQLGLEGLESNAEPVGAALVFLGDQPLVRLPVIEALVTSWQKESGKVVRPRYRGNPHVPGHPTLLDRSIWPLARRLEGDRGLSGLLDSATVNQLLVTVSGDNPDVDTQADLQTLEESSR